MGLLIKWLGIICLTYFVYIILYNGTFGMIALYINDYGVSFAAIVTAIIFLAATTVSVK